MISSCGPLGQAPRRRYRRRAIVLAHLLCVGLYLERLEQGRVWAPGPCPDNCQGGCWRAHSSFAREWVDADCVSLQLTIIRLQCSVCRGVWSLFPAFIWYRHRFSYQMVQSACWQVLSGIPAVVVVEQLSERVSPILEDRNRVHVPAENTVRAWVDRLDKRRGEEAQRAIAAYFGAPPADAATLCRWPNTFNYRNYPEEPGRSVRLLWWQPETRLAFATLFERFLPQAPSRQVPPGPNRGAAWQRFDTILQQCEPLRTLWAIDPASPHDRATLNLALATLLVEHGMDRFEFVEVASLARWNVEPVPEPGELGRVYDEELKRQRGRTQEIAFPSLPGPTSVLPETAWTQWARLCREAVGASTEAPDEFHYLALLTVLGIAFGRNLVLYCGRPIYPNMYTVLVGPTGDRKSTAAQLATELLMRVAPKVLTLNGVGSQEGLMERRPRTSPTAIALC